MQRFIDICSTFERDIPLLILYSANGQEDAGRSGLSVHYEGSLGIERNHPALPEHLDLYDGKNGFSPTLRAAEASKSSVLMHMPNSQPPAFLQGVQWRGHGDARTHIVASPLYVTGLIAGFLIIGVNPRRPFDEAHHLLIEDIGRVCNGRLEQRVSHAQARRREEKLSR